jgi:hypothetical protein
VAAHSRRKEQAQAEPTAAPAEPAVRAAAETTATEDTVARVLTRAERARLGMDSWEPSLLRELLQAHNRLPIDKG